MSDPSSPGGQAAGWYPDPTGRHQYRYWDGSTWTDNVSDGGVATTDPLVGPPSVAAQPQPGPVAPSPTAPGGPASTGGSRTPLFIGLGAAAVLLVAAALVFLVARDGDGAEGLGTFELEADDDEVVLHEVRVPSDTVLLVRVDPDGEFDPLLGIGVDDDLLDEYEDYFGDELFDPDDTEDAFEDFDNEDEIPGTVLIFTDSGFEGDEEEDALFSPFGAEATLVIGGFGGEGGDFELEVTTEDFEARENGEEYFEDLVNEDFFQDFFDFDEEEVDDLLDDLDDLFEGFADEGD